MFDDIKSELSKLVAEEIFNQAKQLGKAAQGAIKKTNLRSGGSGIPESVLAKFEDSFHSTFTSLPYAEDGYAKWRQDGSETKFRFLLRAPLVDSIAKSDWAAAAKNTADGTAQIAALGDLTAYNKAIATSIAGVFDFSVAKLVGTFQSKSSEYGWRFLTKVMTVNAAQEGTTDFQPTQLLYWSYGKDAETKAEYKLAKSLMTTGLFRKTVSPSAGPFISRRARRA